MTVDARPIRVGPPPRARARLAIPDPPSPVGVETAALSATARLRDQLALLGQVVVAFSGGADSAFLASVATATLGRDAVVCVTAVSPSLAPEERDDCRLLATEWDLRHLFVETDELARSAYVANGLDRCYHCKAELMDVLAPIAARERASIVLGVNLDDLGDHRPGQQAATDQGAGFPLVEAGFTKALVRVASRRLGLRTWDKPAAACLASRVPHGMPVTVRTLGQVERAESALRSMGFRQLRVRHHGEIARLEVDTGEMADVVARREEVLGALTSAGYRYVTLDLEGFRSGGLSRAAIEDERRLT